MIIVATRCQILRGSLLRSPDPLYGGEGLAATSPRTPPALSALRASNLYTKFVELILTKIIIIVATRCQILRLICTKFYFEWGSAPDSAGELTVLPRSSIWWGEAGCAPPREPSPLLSVPGSFSQILAPALWRCKSMPTSYAKSMTSSYWLAVMQ